jgi:hypothetical protein
MKLILSIVIIAFIILRVSDYNETNVRCTFIQNDIKSTLIHDDHNNILSLLSYGFKISDDDALEISNNLVRSTKITMSPSDMRIVEGGICCMIELYDKRIIWLYSKDDNSVYALLDKIGENRKVLSVQSSWLASYLERVKHQLSS